MQCAIHVDPSYSVMQQRGMLRRNKTLMTAATHVDDQIDYAVYQLDEKSAGRANDVIITAHSITGANNDEMGLIVSAIKELRTQYKDNIIAVNIHLPDDRIALDFRTRLAFNAQAAGADLVHADAPFAQTEKINNELGLKTVQTDRRLKSLIDAIALRKIGRKIVSPEFVTFPRSGTVTLGNLSIEKPAADKRVALVYDELHRPITDITSMEANILWTLAHFKGSFLGHDALMRAAYLGDHDTLDGRPEINAKVPQQKTMNVMVFNLMSTFKETLGTGLIHTQWGVGRYVRDEDFQFERNEPANTAGWYDENEFPFIHKADNRTVETDDVLIHLSNWQNEFLTRLTEQRGQVVPLLDPSDDVQLFYLRQKLDLLIPSDSGQSFGKTLIQTVRANGVRMVYNAEISDFLKKNNIRLFQNPLKTAVSHPISGLGAAPK